MTPRKALEELSSRHFSDTKSLKVVARLIRRYAALRRRSAAVLNALADAMESPKEAASWAKSGDMNGYMDDLEKELRKK